VASKSRAIGKALEDFAEKADEVVVRMEE